MERLERLYKIDQLLRARRVVSRQQFLAELEVSPATFKRDLEYLRDRFGAPLIWDRELGGYRYEADVSFALPGFWLSSAEIHALLAAYELISGAAKGPLETRLRPIRERIASVLDDSDPGAGEIQRRIRICPMYTRGGADQHFVAVAEAVLSRRKLDLSYRVRSRNAATQRRVSPQRLVHYRDNWYLDAWCEERQALRSFSVDAISAAQVLDAAAKDVDEAELDQFFGASYGIFSGAVIGHAVIRFSPERSRYACHEAWHPQQVGHFDEADRWVLRLPYANDTELVMDLLRQGEAAEVLEPESLRRAVREQLVAALAHYASAPAAARSKH